MNFNLSLSLADFAESGFYTPDNQNIALQQVKEFVAKDPESKRPLSELPLTAIYNVILSKQHLEKEGPMMLKLARCLKQLCLSALKALGIGQQGSSAAATGFSVLAPLDEAGQVNQLKLAFFFLCHLVKSAGTFLRVEKAPQGNRKGSSTSSEASITAWQLSRDGLTSLVDFDARLKGSQGVLGVRELKTASLLLQTTALDVLSTPLPTNASNKQVAETTKSIAFEYLARFLCPTEGTEEVAAAAACLDALLALVEQPKQKENVRKDIAKVIMAVMRHNMKAGCSVVAEMVRRISTHQDPKVTAGHGQDNLAAVLAILSAVPGQPGAHLRASFKAQVEQIYSWLHHPRPAVRKEALGILANLQTDRARVPDFWHRLSFAAAVQLLGDKDANLRAKALGVLAIYAEEAANTVWPQQQTLPDEEAPCVLGISAKAFACDLRARLLDRSITVRKRAASTLSAIIAAKPVLGVVEALQSEVMPTLCNLLQLPRDSKLYPGEAAAEPMCEALMGLALPKGAGCPEGVLCLLRLHSTVADDATRVKLEKALAQALLPASGPSDFTPLLQDVLKQASRRDVASFRNLLRSAAEHSIPLRGRMERALWAFAEHYSSLTAETAVLLTRAIFMLGPISNSSTQHAQHDQGNATEAMQQFQWLCNLGHSIVGSMHESGHGNTMNEALRWCLMSVELALKQLPADSAAALQSDTVALVCEVALSAGSTSEEIMTALTTLHALPEARGALTAVLGDLAVAAGITGPASLLPEIDLSTQLKVYLGDHRQPQDQPPASRERAAAAFITALGAMGQTYLKEKSRFLSCLQLQSTEGGNERDGNAAEGGDHLTTTSTVGDDGDPMETDCLQDEGESRAQEASAQKYIEELIEAQESVPAAFLPALLSMLRSGESLLSLPGADIAHVQPAIKAEAIRALQSMAVLSQRLAARCIPIATSILADSKIDSRVTVAAIKLMKDIIETFPTAYGSLLSQLGPHFGPPEHAQHGLPEFVSATAAAAFAELILSNKLKVHDFLGNLGCGLASSYSGVASACTYVLQRLLERAGTGAGERAALVWGVAQQTPIPLRIAATEATLQLISDDDKQNDAFVGPCIAAVLAVCRRSAGGEDLIVMQVIVTMLRALRPSGKMLRSLRGGLESNAGTPVPGNLVRELENFVKRAVVVDRNTIDSSAADGVAEVVGEGNGEGTNGRKRGRPGALGKSSVAQLQQEVLRVLGSMVPARERGLQSLRP